MVSKQKQIALFILMKNMKNSINIMQLNEVFPRKSMKVKQIIGNANIHFQEKNKME